MINQIQESDALSFIKSLPDNSVQLIWTDPPFGTDNKQQIVSTGKSYRDLNSEDAVDLIVSVCSAAYRVLNDSGVLAICLDYRSVHQVAAQLMQTKYVWQGEIIWSFGLGRGASAWWANKHNTILLFSKSKSPKFNPGAVPLIARKASKSGYADTKKMSSIIDCTLSNTDPERVGYPNQKPFAIIKPFIEVHTDLNDLVIDPFGGSGSTAHAAKLLNRRYATADINPLAVATMRARLADV